MGKKKLSVEERLEKLDELDSDQLEALEADVQSAFDQAEEDDDLDTMEAMITALEKVFEVKDSESETESESDEDEDEEDDSESGEAEADTEIKAESKTESKTDELKQRAEAKADEDSKSKSKSTDDNKTETTAEVKAQAETEESDEATTDKEEAPAMAASAEFQPPEDARPVVASADTEIVAGADIQGYSAGSRFNSVSDVSVAFVSRLNSIKRSGRGGDGEQLSVATVVASVPEDRMLVPGDPEGNSTRIEDITGQAAITASGGFCAPLQVKYDIFGLGSTARPVRDSLPLFSATRGGIRFVQPPVLGDYADAVSIWTAANDANPATDTTSGAIVPKPCLKVDCAAETTAETDAVTMCLVFGNLASRAYPELVARNNQLALVEHARLGETTLLNKISAESTAVTSSFQLGAARDFLLALAKAGAAYRNRPRVPRTMPLRVIAPEWVLDAMREDIARQIPGDDAISQADAAITAYLSARNVNVTWHMDDVFSAQGAGALVDFPATINWYIFAEGTFIYLDGGTLDLGVVRDSELVGTNDYKTFVETFEGVAKVGVESVKVTTTTHVEGATVGTIAAA